MFPTSSCCVLLLPCTCFVMKLFVTFTWVLGILSQRVDSFVCGGNSAVANHARSRGVAVNTAFAHSGLAAKPLRAVRGRRDSQLGMSDVAIDADFTLPIAIAGAGLAVTGLGNIGVGFPISVVGLLLAFQATRVVFQFDDEAMEVKIGKDNGDLEDSGENAFVGGESRWNYDTWTNWEVYPSEKLPVLMYFKENQTKPEGQIHFFPFIMKPDALLAEVRARVPQVAK